MPLSDPIRTGLILSGGLALGAYHAGALDLLLKDSRIDLASIAATSIGAINGAIIADNPPEERVSRLIAFWEAVAMDTHPWFDPLNWTRLGRPRHAWNWISASTVRFVGSPCLFRPRRPGDQSPSAVPSFYILHRIRKCWKLSWISID